jgi:hypothetical protein
MVERVIFAGDTGIGIIDQTKVGVRCFYVDLGLGVR